MAGSGWMLLDGGSVMRPTSRDVACLALRWSKGRGRDDPICDLGVAPLPSSKEGEAVRARRSWGAHWSGKKKKEKEESRRTHKRRQVYAE